MSASILLLHAGNSERTRVDELAATLGRLGSRVAVKDLAGGDYDQILDAVAAADTVAYWPAARPASSV